LQMLISFKRAITSVVLRVKIKRLDTGQGLTGLAHDTSGLRISTIVSNEASATSYTSAGSTIETITTLGTYAAPTATKCRFKEVDATNHPGHYEIHLADARFAVASAEYLIVTVRGVTNAAECDVIIPLNMDVNLTTVNDTAPTLLSEVDANLTKLGGSAASMTALKAMADTCTVGVVVDDAGNSSTTFKTDLTNANTNFYGDGSAGGAVLAFTSGNCAGQARRITAFNFTTDFITVEAAFLEEPAAGDDFVILGRIEV
jgi:hypothetical protein